MRWWRISGFLLLAAMLGAMGCGSSSSSGVSLTISPTVASVITNRTQQFSGLVTGSSNTSITWSLTCETGVAAGTCGQIDAAGLYTAPGTIPTIPATSSTTTPTPAPTVTITGTAQADTSKTATATLTIVTAISITITPTSATVGTGETFPFTATVANPGCNTTSTSTCENVTWSLSTTLTGIGSFISSICTAPSNGQAVCTGVYKAPATVPSPSTVIITATSVADTSITATGTVTVVTATQPTVTSVSPNATATGGLFQDVYITGTNFISTNIVYVNHAQLSPSLVTQVSPALIRARIPDFILAAPPSSGFLQIGVSEQTGSEQACSGSDQSPCQIAMMNERPGLVGPNPDSILQGAAGVQSFNVDGGFFGTGLNPADPAVNATFNGQLRGISLPGSQTIGSTRQLTVSLGGGSNSNDFSVPGLYPVAIQNTRDSSKFAVTNLAVQPNYNGGSSISLLANLSVGTSPSAVAINPRTGMAVVANTGSNDIYLINFAPSSGPPAVIARICTFAPGLSEPCPSGTPSGPVSVAIDDVLNEAVVANSASNSIAIVDLTKQEVSTTIGLQNTPGAVGVNPITGLALVAMQQQSYGVLLNLNASAICQGVPGGPCIAGIVSISTGTNTKVAVEPHLNWALASPGGGGSLAIVDLSNQSTNTITAISRTTNSVTVTVQSAQNAPPILVSPGDTVQISGVTFPQCPPPPAQPTPGCVTAQVAALAPTFNGYYTVSSVGPGPNQFSYSQTGQSETDVATQSTPQVASGSVFSSEPVAIKSAQINAEGIAINPETQQAVLVDPTTGGLVTFFSLLDQSLSTLSLTLNNQADVGTNAVAYNPLTNTVVAVNSITDKVSIIDPTTPRRLNDSNLFQLSCSKGCGPSAVAVDPGTNIALVTNQTDNSVSILNLVSPTAAESFAITDTDTKVFVSNSTLGSGPNPKPPPIMVIGTGFGAACATPPSTSLQVRLDGVAIPTTCVADARDDKDRVLKATPLFSMVLAPHLYALDVFNPSTNQSTNAESFAVEQSVDVSTACSVPPQPAGVAIDPVNKLVAVSLFGCDSLALINLTTMTGKAVILGQNANPIGVAVLPRLQRVVVANNGTGTASIFLESGQPFQTVSTGSGPMGAAADEATGEVAIANSVANTVTVVNAVTGGTSTISTGQRPVAVGFNYVNHQVAAAASASNLVGISGGTTGSANQSFSVQGPSSVVYDPVPTDCGSNNNGATTNTTGCFMVSSSLDNSVDIIDPVTSAVTPFAIGINPTSIAYNYFTSTLVSTNTASRTITVADLLALKVRSVIPLPPVVPTNTNQALTIAVSGIPQYALDVNPLTNVAVVADTANGAVLFVPLPR